MKRKYVEPNLVRVKLNPEQAVLSQCSAAWSGAKDASGLCHDSCRRKASGGAATSAS